MCHLHALKRSAMQSACNTAAAEELAVFEAAAVNVTGATAQIYAVAETLEASNSVNVLSGSEGSTETTDSVRRCDC